MKKIKSFLIAAIALCTAVLGMNVAVFAGGTDYTVITDNINLSEANSPAIGSLCPGSTATENSYLTLSDTSKFTITGVTWTDSKDNVIVKGEQFLGSETYTLNVFVTANYITSDMGYYFNVLRQQAYVTVNGVQKQMKVTDYSTTDGYVTTIKCSYTYPANPDDYMEYGMINGAKITSENLEDVLGPYDGAGATVKFTPQTSNTTGMLKLDNASLTAGILFPKYYAKYTKGIASDDEQVDHVFVDLAEGSVNSIIDNDNLATYSVPDLWITGKGTLSYVNNCKDGRTTILCEGDVSVLGGATLWIFDGVAAESNHTGIICKDFTIKEGSNVIISSLSTKTTGTALKCDRMLIDVDSLHSEIILSANTRAIECDVFYVDLNQKQIKISDVKNPTEDEAWIWTYTTDGIKLQDERIKFFQVADYLNGWIEEDGSWYLYSNNEKLTGWQMNNGNWYYLNKEGIMLTGWIQDNGNKYYLRTSGAMATGWVQDGGKWYYMRTNGAMATGWVQDGGKWYYMSASGTMVTGWVQYGGKWYYMRTNGVMATGWVQDGGKWYYMNANGVMATGWVQYGGKWYFLESNGAMATNKWINGIYYVKSNGEMAVNEWVDGGRYYVGADGKWVPNKTK